MIENATQYRVTAEAAAKFRQAIRDHDQAQRPDDIHPRLWKAQRDAMFSQLEELEGELAAYDEKGIND